MTPQTVSEIDALLGNKPHSKKESRAWGNQRDDTNMCSQKRQRTQGGKDGTRRTIAFLLSRILQHLHAFCNMLPAHTALLSVTLLKYPNISYQLNTETAVRNITEMRRTTTIIVSFLWETEDSAFHEEVLPIVGGEWKCQKAYLLAGPDGICRLFLQFPLRNFQFRILWNGSNVIQWVESAVFSLAAGSVVKFAKIFIKRTHAGRTTCRTCRITGVLRKSAQIPRGPGCAGVRSKSMNACACGDTLNQTLRCWCCTRVTLKMDAGWRQARMFLRAARPVCWGVHCLSHFIFAVQESVAKTPACDRNNMQWLQTAVWTHHKSSSISLLSIAPGVYNGAPVPLRESVQLGEGRVSVRRVPCQNIQTLTNSLNFKIVTFNHYYYY